MYAYLRQAGSTFLLLALMSLDGIQAGIVVETELTQEKVVQAGENYRGAIVLRNTDSTPTEAKVYQTDYSFTADGKNHYGERGRLPRSNANWVSLSRELVIVPANGIERIDYDVRIPGGKGNEISGTYWSVIMIEPIAKGSAESASEMPDGSTQVTHVMRYAIQVISQIGKTGSVGLSFANPKLVKVQGKRIFAIDVENTGQRSLKSSLWLEIYSEMGKPIGKFQGEARRLYPGTSARFQIDLGQTPDGKYLGMVAVDGTGDNLFGANVELEIK